MFCIVSFVSLNKLMQWKDGAFVFVVLMKWHILCALVSHSHNEVYWIRNNTQKKIHNILKWLDDASKKTPAPTDSNEQNDRFEWYDMEWIFGKILPLSPWFVYSCCGCSTTLKHFHFTVKTDCELSHWFVWCCEWIRFRHAIYLPSFGVQAFTVFVCRPKHRCRNILLSASA